MTSKNADQEAINSAIEQEIERWNARYQSVDDYMYGTAPSQFVVANADRIPANANVLCVADGEGRNGVWLAEQGCTVTSVDASHVALKRAEALAQDRGVTIKTVLANLQQWDWPQARFDAVVCVFIQFVGARLRQTIFNHAMEALKPGGVFLLHGYRTEQIQFGTGGPPHVENLYTESGLRRELAMLEKLQIRSYDAEIYEGSGHVGMSALVDVVGYRAR